MSNTDSTLLTPPHNIALEKSVLSALMNTEGSFDKLEGGLEADDFFGERHKIIFECIAHLATSNASYDGLSVFDSLQRQEKLSAVGGEAYLTEVSAAAGTAFNLENYASRVREMSVYRKLIAAGNNILELAYHPKERELTEVLDSAESQIFAISESVHKRQGKQGVKDSFAITSEIVDFFEEMKGSQAGALIGLSTQFTELDNKIQGLQKGHLLILAARPGMGKTTLALNFIQSVITQKRPVVMFSMEMKSSEIAMRLISSWSSVPLGIVQGGVFNPTEWEQAHNGIGMLMNSKLYIDDRNNLTPSEMRSVCRKIAKDNPPTKDEPEGGIGLIVVDYLQLMSVPSKSANRVLEVGEISRSLKALAREMDCPVLALSQLSRDSEKRPNKRPLASDLRESGTIEQDADIIMFIYRDEVYYPDRKDNKGLAEIIVEKNRHGARGKIMLEFSGITSRFLQLTHSIEDSYVEHAGGE